MQNSVPLERKHGSAVKHDIFSSEKNRSVLTVSGLCTTEIILDALLLP